MYFAVSLSPVFPQPFMSSLFKSIKLSFKNKKEKLMVNSNFWLICTNHIWRLSSIALFPWNGSQSGSNWHPRHLCATFMSRILEILIYWGQEADTTASLRHKDKVTSIKRPDFYKETLQSLNALLVTNKLKQSLFKMSILLYKLMHIAVSKFTLNERMDRNVSNKNGPICLEQGFTLHVCTQALTDALHWDFNKNIAFLSNIPFWRIHVVTLITKNCKRERKEKFSFSHRKSLDDCYVIFQDMVDVFYHV